MTKHFLTTSEVAVKAGLSRRGVTWLVQTGALTPTAKAGRDALFSEEEIEAWVHARGRKNSLRGPKTRIEELVTI